MNSFQDAFACCTVTSCNRQFFEHFSCFGTDDMSAKKFALLGIEDQLHEAFRMTDSAGFAACSER